MSINLRQQNPFDLVKASDFSDEQVRQYWVDLAGEATLFDLLKPKSQMSMLLLGSKGSGKTHLMRYYSAAVRRISQGTNPLDTATSDGYLGIYVRADGLNVGRFSRKGQTDEAWASVFSYYFEIWLATHLLRAVAECVGSLQPEFDETRFVSDVRQLFNSFTTGGRDSIDALIDEFAQDRREIDHVVGNTSTGGRQLTEIDIRVSPGDLVFGIPELIATHIPALKGVLFVYMIDEIENFSETQQRFLNSLLRYKRGPVSIKIGTRLYGMRTRQTLGDAAEEIRPGAEYDEVRLDEWLRDHSDGYKSLAGKLIRNRLEQAGFVRRDEAFKVEDFFASLDASDDYREPAKELVARYDREDRERPYFVKLRQHIREFATKDGVNAPTTVADQVINSLRVADHPLMEKVNVYLLYKNWGAAAGLIAAAEGIAVDARMFRDRGKAGAKRYFEALDHFKSDFLAQLYKDCERRHVPYAGFDTLIHLSQGVPRNLLGLLKSIYRRSHFAGEKPFVGGNIISVDAQNEGIRDAAAWFWDDAQPDSCGPEARQAVGALAEFFSAVRFSLKPAECDLATFTVSPNVGTVGARDNLQNAENWSYLIRIRSGGSDRNDPHSVDEKFQLSPILAPRWDVSEHRRGAISLTESLFNAIFDVSMPRTESDAVKKDRLRGMQEPYRRVLKRSAEATSQAEVARQARLF